MGCLCSSTLTTEVDSKEVEKKGISWDNKELASQSEYVIENVHGETLTRHAGDINGQSVTVQNCKDSNIYLFDHMASATVVDCINCHLFIGPVKASALLRNCTDCAVMVACMQFHASNCRNIDSYLCSSTKPTIVSSSEMRFGCYQYFYPELEEQFNQAQLSAYNNYWADIIDSTPAHEDRNFQLIPSDRDVNDLIPLVDSCVDKGVTTDKVQSVVPSTPADKLAPLDMLCVVMFFCDGLSHERARIFIREIETKHPDCRLMQCREQAMNEDTAVTVFGTDKYNMAVQRGAVISLVYSGTDSCNICQTTLVAVSCGSTGLVATSANSEIASRQVKAFFGTDAPRLAPSSSIRLRRC